MAATFSVVGLFVALALLVILIFRGWHMAVAAFLAAMVVILTSGMDIWPKVSETFAGGFQKFAGTWFLMFTLGATFGKIMEVSGASSSIANSVVRLVGHKHVVLVVLVTTMVLAYGGIGTFIIAFTMYPICLALFKEGNVPKRVFPGLLLAQPATTCMVALPGTTAISNMLPTQVFGTTIYAAPMMGILTSIFIFSLHYTYFTWVVRRCWKRGDNFIPGDHDVIVDFTSAEAVAKLPRPFVAFIPIIVLVVSIFIFQLTLKISNYAVVLGITLAIVVGIFLFKNKLSAKQVIADGTGNGFNALMMISCIMGFGAVVTDTAAFKNCVDWLLSMKINPLLFAFIAVNVICAITGSSVGGLSIFLNTMGSYMLTTGIQPEALHRLMALASAGFDAMPHSSGPVLANVVAKTEMRDTYQYVFMSICIIPVLGYGFAVGLYYLGII